MGMGGEAVYILKDARAQVILEAAGKYSFIKEFIKVRDRAPQLLEREKNEEFIQLPSSTLAGPVVNHAGRKEIT